MKQTPRYTQRSWKLFTSLPKVRRRHCQTCRKACAEPLRCALCRKAVHERCAAPAHNARMAVFLLYSASVRRDVSSG